MWQYYNTGDQVWMEWRNNKWKVVRVETHDCLSWWDGDPGLTKMVGLDKFCHQILVACIKLAHRWYI